MNRLRGSGKLFSGTVPQLKNIRHKALRSWTAVQDTYFSTKDVFESHKVVFTVGTSIASVATAWIGYTVRHLHDTRVDKRLESIEKSVSTVQKVVDILASKSCIPCNKDYIVQFF